MDSASTTTSTAAAMGAKLMGARKNYFRPVKQNWEDKQSGEIVTGRCGVSRPTECLFLADDGSLKWVAVNAGVFPGFWSCDDTSHLVFPPFPTGPWNVGQIGRLENGEVGFKQTLEKTLEGIENAWHPIKVEFTELELISQFQDSQFQDSQFKDTQFKDTQFEDSQCKGNNDPRLWQAMHPLFDEKTLLVKLAPWPTPSSKEAIETETRVYQAVDGLGIAPEFLGHVTYRGTVIGFILEWVEGAQTAEREDEAARIEAVKKLHALGITHGSAHHLNFLKKGEDMLMVDFEQASFGDEATEKRKEEDIRRICDFENGLFWAEVDEAEVDEADEASEADEADDAPYDNYFFNDMVDDEINWSDDSEAYIAAGRLYRQLRSG